MAEPIETLFGIGRLVGLRKHVLGGYLLNTIVPSMCGGDAACCQITLTTCLIYCLLHILLIYCILHTLPLRHYVAISLSEVDSFSRTSNTANIFAFCRLSKWNQMFIIYSLLLTGVAYRGEVDIFSFVCLFVSLFVCHMHDNFRTIKSRMTKLGGWVHCTKISREFECQGQRSKIKVTGDKRKRKSAAFCSGVVLLRRGPSAACFSGVVLGGRGPLRRWENQHMLSSFV